VILTFGIRLVADEKQGHESDRNAEGESGTGSHAGPHRGQLVWRVDGDRTRRSSLSVQSRMTNDSFPMLPRRAGGCEWTMVAARVPSFTGAEAGVAQSDIVVVVRQAR
jgi:hypothetical protein